MKRSYVVAAVAILLCHAHALAAERCPAGQSGCTLDNAPQRIQQRVNEGAAKVLEDENPGGRVQEVKDTLEGCIDCAMDAIEGGMDDTDEGTE